MAAITAAYKTVVLLIILMMQIVTVLDICIKRPVAIFPVVKIKRQMYLLPKYTILTHLKIGRSLLFWTVCYSAVNHLYNSPAYAFQKQANILPFGL